MAEIARRNMRIRQSALVLYPRQARWAQRPNLGAPVLPVHLLLSQPLRAVQVHQVRLLVQIPQSIRAVKNPPIPLAVQVPQALRESYLSQVHQLTLAPLDPRLDRLLKHLQDLRVYHQARPDLQGLILPVWAVQERQHLHQGAQAYLDHFYPYRQYPLQGSHQLQRQLHRLVECQSPRQRTRLERTTLLIERPRQLCRCCPKHHSPYRLLVVPILQPVRRLRLRQVPSRPLLRSLMELLP